MYRMTLLSAAAVAAAALVSATSAGAKAVPTSPTATSSVVVPRGQPVQVAFTADTTHVSVIAEVSTSAEDAIQMAIAQHPTIRGFRVRVNDVETDCSGDNTVSATAIRQQHPEHRCARIAPFLEPYPALYFDAASLLLSDLQKVSKIVNGNLVIDRAALASAVRNTTNFQGVSCTIMLDPSTGNRINDLGGCSEN